MQAPKGRTDTSDPPKTSDLTKDPEFQRVLGDMLKMPPKPQSEIKSPRVPRAIRTAAEAAPRGDERTAKRLT